MRFGILLTLLLAACGPAALPSPSGLPQVTGTITLPDETMIESLGPGSDEQHFDCQGAGEFEDLLAGSQVIARDGAGAVVGTGQVTVGQAPAERPSPTQPLQAIPPCVMPFEIEVQAADFYTFAIAGWPVELVYSRGDLEAISWRLELAPAD